MLRYVALFLLCSCLFGCRRRAPGPEECVQFAQRASGMIQQPRQRAIVVRERFEELTRRCLTTPYDYEMLNCFNHTGQVQYCAREFERRSGRSSDVL